jgi:hypothetical protein
MQMSEVMRWRIRHVGGTGDDLSTPASSSSSGALGETRLVCRLGRSGAFLWLSFSPQPAARCFSYATLITY